jgi:N-acetyl-gamma-glutamyl-phosphate reductase
MQEKSYAVFIDGQEGTTGLRLAERLSRRQEIKLLAIDPALRKNMQEKVRLAKMADVVFLCLPDGAAKEMAAVLQQEAPEVRLIDASTAHRVDPSFTYGLPELEPNRRMEIQRAKRVSVPGCHATGFLLLVRPLRAAGLLPENAPLCIHSVTGYSGGGKSMIAAYGDENRHEFLNSPRQYALGQTHKHLPEMQVHGKMAFPPLFSPIVADFYSGMAVTLPLHGSMLTTKVKKDDILALFQKTYANCPLVHVCESPVDGFLPANALSGADGALLSVSGNDERILLTAVYDNLGKGASGAAIQCMNIMLGLPEDKGLMPGPLEF